MIAAVLLGACTQNGPSFRTAACSLSEQPTATSADRDALGERASGVLRSLGPSGKPVPIARGETDLFLLVSMVPTFAGAPPGQDPFAGGPSRRLGNGQTVPKNLDEVLLRIADECD